jgi:hypothetical protein
VAEEAAVERKEVRRVRPLLSELRQPWCVLTFYRGTYWGGEGDRPSHKRGVSAQLAVYV